MKLSRELIRRMTGNNSRYASSVSGGGGGGGSASYAAEAGHAATADEATHATSADEANHAATANEATHATSADEATHAATANVAQNLTSDSSDWNKILRKDIADTAREVITFAKGLIATLKSYFQGGIEVVGGTKTDSLNVTQDATIGRDFSVQRNATIGGSVTAAQLIASLLKTPDFQEAVGMIGLGFGVTTDANGRATLQTDDLLVLGRMIVNSLNIREVSYIGGTYLLTPAGSTVAKVQSLYTSSSNQSDTRYWSISGSGTVVGYRLLWKADDGTTCTMNYWRQGDQAFCQTFNLAQTGQYTQAANRRYWRMVCRVGQWTDADGNVWHYADVANVATVYLYDSNGRAIYNVNGGTFFTGYENANGTTPQTEDKVVCLGSQADTTRQGAIQLTAEGTASMGIYDGINEYLALSNFEIHYLSKEEVRMDSDRFKWRSGGTTQSQSALVSHMNTRISTAEQSVSRLSATVDGVETQVSEIVQTSDSINLSVSYDDSGVQNALSDPHFTASGTDTATWSVKNGTISAYNDISNYFTSAPSNALTSTFYYFLRQYLRYDSYGVSRIVAGRIYKLSFYARTDGDIRIDSPINVSSSAYSTLRYIRVIKGQKYRISVTGYASADGQIAVRLYHNSNYISVGSIDTENTSTITAEFTATANDSVAIQVSGQGYVVAANVNASVFGLGCNVGVYDSTYGMIVDGTPTTAGQQFFRATTEWSRHSLIFKARAANLSYFGFQQYYNSPAVSIYAPCLEEVTTEALKRTGVDIITGKVVVKADDFTVTDSEGFVLMQVSTTGGIKMIETEVQGTLDVVCTDPLQGFTATASVKQHVWGAGLDITTTDGNDSSYARIGTQAGGNQVSIDCYSNYGNSPSSVHVDPSGIKIIDGNSELDLNHEELSIGDLSIKADAVRFGAFYLSYERDGVGYYYEDSLGGTGRSKVPYHCYISVNSGLYILIIGGIVVGKSNTRPGSRWTELTAVNPDDIW